MFTKSSCLPVKSIAAVYRSKRANLNKRIPFYYSLPVYGKMTKIEVNQLEQLQSPPTQQPPPLPIQNQNIETTQITSPTSPQPHITTDTTAAIANENAGANATTSPITTESPITQVTKSRHRRLISHLLCCFRPTSSNLNHNSNCIYSVSGSNPVNSRIYSGEYLLPARKPSDNRICLVIDLDETLVHSSFKPIDDADFTVPVELNGTLHKVYVLKRPHVDEFLKKMGELFECVLFTASLAKYADPVADILDTDNIFKARLFRESCAYYRGSYVKDLSRLGRDLNRVIIVDNSPASYIFHPENALPVSSYFDDKRDEELLNLIPLLERIASNTGAVVPIKKRYKKKFHF